MNFSPRKPILQNWHGFGCITMCASWMKGRKYVIIEQIIHSTKMFFYRSFIYSNNETMLNKKNTDKYLYTTLEYRMGYKRGRFFVTNIDGICSVYLIPKLS